MSFKNWKSTHNLCFGAKIRTIGISLRTPVLLYKSGVQGGIHSHGHVFVMILNSFCLIDPWYHLILHSLKCIELLQTILHS